MTQSNGRILFTTAALFNWAAAIFVFLMPAQLAATMGLPPGPAGSVWGQVGGAAIVVFGWAYWMISRDVVRYRPYILLGIVGKVTIVLVMVGNWIAGTMQWPLAALIQIDAIYAVLFARFLARTRA